MSGTKGYRSYRGRMPKGRIALMVILILVIVASAAVIWLQNYVVYTADGQIRLELPWQREETPPAEEETLPEEDVKVIADAEQIKRVIHNIINNSLKYIDKPKGKINLRVKDVGDFVQVELEVNGCGIAAKDLTNIFERFYRTDASRNSSKGGSGIGLSVVKKIIEDHGGKIWATSREGTGTTMYFVLRKYQEVPVNE